MKHYQLEFIEQATFRVVCVVEAKDEDEALQKALIDREVVTELSREKEDLLIRGLWDGPYFMGPVETLTPEEKHNALVAFANGIFDDPDLLKCGPLNADENTIQTMSRINRWPEPVDP